MTDVHLDLEAIQRQFEQPIVVLLVDDQAIIGEAVRRMLAPHSDITFHYCQNPHEALRRAAELQPTAILQDLVMPDIDGLDLVPQYRQQEATKDTPLIVLSTREEPVTKAEAFARGANDYLVKLPDQVELVARIRYHSKGYISLLQRNAAYEAIAVSRQRLAEQMEAGAKYLSALLPTKIDQPIAVDWRYVPSADIGGDTFGYHWIDDQHFAFYLIDVTGHGLDSALLSVSVMNLLRSGSLADTDFRQPGQVLAALNDTFPMEKYGEKCFTIWYGVYQPQNRTLVWCGGGHPDALLFAASDGTAPLQLESQGPMMGMIPWSDFETGQQSVPPGARLYVYSDGCQEVHKVDGGEWTFAEFVEFLSRAKPGEQSPMDQLLQHVRQIHGSDLLDDDFSMLEIVF